MRRCLWWESLCWYGNMFKLEPSQMASLSAEESTVILLHVRQNRCDVLLVHMIITFTMAKVMFSSLSVGLSVCLSVCYQTENGWTDFHEIFREVGFDTRNNWEHFQDVPFNLLNTGTLFPLFRRNPCLLAALQKMLWLTLWILGRFTYCLDPCL